jgi:hypothetical protein
MRRGFRISILFAIAPLILSFVGCEKKHALAIVLEKEHIAAKKMSDASPSSSPEPSATVTEYTSAPNEITVDQYIMKAADRGTERDPRATNHEQWIVKVRTRAGRQFNVQTAESRWKRLDEGDRVFVNYRQGKYTGTIWDSEIR